MNLAEPGFRRHDVPCTPGARFSIVIPTWNNLPFLKLCIRSLREHSRFDHQIILHINDGSDGTLVWAEKEGLSFTHSPVNVGVCHAVNLARSLVETDYICYMNDDMFVCPDWDLALWEEVSTLGHPWFFLSATMLEPHPTRSKPVLGGRDYGATPETFSEARLLSEYAKPEKPDWCGATRPPNLVHRDVWDLVGGYSLEFAPGLYSDPDFSMKLWTCGVRYFRGISRSRVYHFVSKSLGRIVPNDGRRQFLSKWGMTSSTFEKHILRLGEPFDGDLPDRPDSPALRKALLKNRIQKFFMKPGPTPRI